MQITEVQIHGTAHTYLLYQPLLIQDSLAQGYILANPSFQSATFHIDSFLRALGCLHV